MKKLPFILLFSIVTCATLQAEEVDVTSYIQNAGFDEDLTFQVDGTAKEIVNKDYSFGERSQAWVAADNSVYAWGKGTRPDGYSPAWNGFYGQIKGWQQGDKSYTGKLYYPFGSEVVEWVYFGTVPYAIGATAVPISDDKTSFLTAPSKPADYDTEDNIGFMYLSAGWGGSATYKQVVSLPCAKYRLEYWTINANANATNGTNMTRVVCRMDVFTEGTAEEAKASMLKTEWTKHEIEFTPTAEFTVEFGFKAEGSSSVNPILCIDGIKLYKIGEADPEELVTSMKLELESLVSYFNEVSYSNIVSQINDFMTNVLDKIDTSNSRTATAAITEADAEMKKFREVYEQVSEIEAVLEKTQKVLAKYEYPGETDLQAAYDAALALRSGTYDASVDYAAQLLTVVATLNEAIINYYQSQAASVDTPADYTFYIKNPWFIVENAEPTFDGNDWVFPHAENYIDDSINEDLTSEGWQITSTVPYSEQYLIWSFNRSCWKVLSNGDSGTLGISQTLTDLPNGYYTVSADLVTQKEFLTDQHVFAKSSVDSKISESLKLASEEENQWELVSLSADQKVLVVDGQLTIGAESTCAGNGAVSSFMVTNFKLYYLGEAPADALKNLYTATLAGAQELFEKMHFAADKQALGDMIKMYGDATDYVSAISELRKAIEVAEASEATYQEHFVNGAALSYLKERLDHSDYIGDVLELAQFIYDYAINWSVSDEATYVNCSEVINNVQSYLYSYIPTFQQAVNFVNISGKTGSEALNDMMTSQLENVLVEVMPTDIINYYVDELNRMMQLVKQQNAWENTDENDYTVFIKNPKLESADGWQWELGNGKTFIGAGQWYDDLYTRYIDSYHSSDILDEAQGEVVHTGLENFMVWQEITNLPNGTYRVGVYTRTPAEGAYIFTTVDDANYVEIPLHYSVNPTTGEQVLASDKFGPMWEEAYLKIVEEGMPTEDSMFEYYNAIYNANNAMGRGWRHQEIDVTVTNHQLTIGVMAGDGRTTEKKFAGDWFSAGGWTLTLTEMGDNTNWEGPMGQESETPILSGDANDDGKVSMGDAVTIVNYVLGKELSSFNMDNADVNGSGTISMGDAVLVVNIVLDINHADGSRSTSSDVIGKVSMTSQNGQIAVALDNAVSYTAFQMDLTLPDGVNMEDLAFTGRATHTHSLSFREQSDGKIRIVGWSAQNAALKENSGDLLTIRLQDKDITGAVSIENILFTTTEGTEHQLAPATFYGGTTGITSLDTDQSHLIIYDLQGRRVQNTQKGLYIHNGKKLIGK